MTEALVNNERCFLEQERWKPVFRSIAVKESGITDRSQITISLMMLKSNIPGIFVDVTNIICYKHCDPPYVDKLVSFIQTLRSDLADWSDEYQQILKDTPEAYPGTMEYDRQAKVFATYLSCVILSNRLLAALVSQERIQLELEAHTFIHKMLAMEEEGLAHNSAACLFMAQTAGVAKVTWATRVDWLEENKDRGPEGFIEKPKFERWCRLMGRSTR